MMGTTTVILLRAITAVATVAAAGVLAMIPETAPSAPTIESLWQRLSGDATWRAAGISERDRFQMGMLRLLQAANSCDLSEIAAQRFFAGTPFAVSVWPEQHIWAVHEREGQYQGSGLYLIRCGGDASPLVVQAPHSFFDRETRRIGQRLFAKTRARAAFFNTVHRFRSHPGELPADLVHAADVAHQYGTFFQAATVATVVSELDLKVVQIHGFSEERSLPYEVIVSSGNRKHAPTTWSERLAAMGRIGIYGHDADTFGGSTNVQALAINRSHQGRFLHLEMSLETRIGLAQPEALGALVEALRQPW